MRLKDFRQHLRSSTLFRTVAPTMLGGVILLSSSCSNVREFAAKPFQKNAPVAEANEDLKKEKVEHALAGQSDSDKDFIKLLKHKMSSRTKSSASSDQRTTQSSGEMTVQEMIEAGQDPFLSSVQPSQPIPEPVQTAQIVETKIPVMETSKPAATSGSLQGAGLPRIAPKPEPKQNIQLTSAEEQTVQPILETSTQQQVATSEICEPPAAACPPAWACPPGGPAFGELINSQPFASPTFRGPEVVGDEYLRDGGDRGTKVYYHDYVRYGLDTEDTVVEWTDELGVARVKPSTKTAIYAPRFGAVRSASLPHTDVKVAKAAGHQDQQRLSGIDTQLIIDEKVHNDEAIAMLMRSRSSGLESKTTENEVHQNQSAEKHVKLLNVYEDFRFFREGRFDKVNIAVIGEAVEAAFDWSIDQGVVIYANDVAGQVVQGRVTAQDYTGVEDRRKPGDLTIVKIVDKTVAKPGDELTFTIRFDNIGDKPLRNVRVVDNLSPRLQYIEGSVKSELDGKLDTEKNGRGSQVLTFSFSEELKGRTGGWVSFKCRVR